jgi:hypothetical protein
MTVCDGYYVASPRKRYGETLSVIRTSINVYSEKLCFRFLSVFSDILLALKTKNFQLKVYTLINLT